MKPPLHEPISATWKEPMSGTGPALRDAMRRDWELGRPETIARESPGRGGMIAMGEMETEDGYSGLVILADAGDRPLKDYRSIPRNHSATYREVFAVSADGGVIHVGRLRRPR